MDRSIDKSCHENPHKGTAVYALHRLWAKISDFVQSLRPIVCASFRSNFELYQAASVCHQAASARLELYQAASGLELYQAASVCHQVAPARLELYHCTP